MKTRPAIRHILLALHVYDERLHRGVMRFAIEHGWQVTLVGPTSWKHHRHLVPDGVISMMSPDPGVPVAGRSQSPQGGFFADNDAADMSRHVASLGRPSVDLGHFHPEVPTVRVVPDNREAGRLAARHLVACGGRHFLHVTNGRNTQDAERRDGFLEALRESGFDADVLYTGEKPVGDDAAMLAELRRHPAPLSVFCSFDIWAGFVLAACRLGRLRVPEDVAILGCYNHELISAFESPPVSSVDMDIESRGYIAARTLSLVMRGDMKPGEVVRTPVRGVVARESTDRSAAMPRELAAALHHIGVNLGKPLDVPGVAQAVGASRSVLQKQSLATLGHGLGEAIARARIAKAKELLAGTTLTATAIAYETGHSSPFHFYRVFRKHTGMTAGSFRGSAPGMHP